MRYDAHIMEQGMAQQRGRQRGTTAPPDLVFVFDFEPDSYSYMPDPLAQRPCYVEQHISELNFKKFFKQFEHLRLPQNLHASPRAWL